MKKFLIGILTILLTLVFLVLGISLTIEKTITENVSTVVKATITETIVKEVAKSAKVDEKAVKQELAKVLEKNEALNKTLEDSLDKAMDMLSGKQVEDFNFSKELEDVINNSEDVLKEYGITITQKEKEELIEMVNSEELNNELKETIQEAQESIPESAKTAIDAFNFIRSTTFKLLLIVGIVVILALIALLKKSCFKWLSNLGVVTLICGIFYSVAISYAVDVVSNDLALSSKNITLSMSAMNYYGYVLLGIGIVSLILNIVLTKTVKQSEKIESKE